MRCWINQAETTSDDIKRAHQLQTIRRIWCLWSQSFRAIRVAPSWSSMLVTMCWVQPRMYSTIWTSTSAANCWAYCYAPWIRGLVELLDISFFFFLLLLFFLFFKSPIPPLISLGHLLIKPVSSWRQPVQGVATACPRPERLNIMLHSYKPFKT